MAVKILMPALSPTMEHGTISNWLVKEGDNVSAGDVLLEIETDKATMEVEAVDEGVISKILLQDGTEDVPINTVIALLKEEGDSDEDVEKLLEKSTAPSTCRLAYHCTRDSRICSTTCRFRTCRKRASHSHAYCARARKRVVSDFRLAARASQSKRIWH